MTISPARGEVWLVRFPFTDLSSSKLRPSLVLAVHGEDVIVAGIFSRLPAESLRQTWMLLREDHPAFGQTGLKKASLLRAEKIAVVHVSVFQRKLGVLSAELMVQVDESVRNALNLQPSGKT